MTVVARKFVLFRTDLFVSRTRDEDIDRWSVGGDCAGWFCARLLLTGRICRGGDPVMEDWGWTFAVAGSLLTWRIDLPCWPAAAA